MTDITNEPSEAQADLENAPVRKKAKDGVVIVPPEAVKEAAEKGIGLQVTLVTAYSGPLPPPDLLKAYDEAVPGLSRTIVEQFTKQGNHRRRIQTVGQVGALLVAAASIVVGGLLAYALENAWAALAVIGPVCSVVGTAQLLEYWFKAPKF